MDAVVGIGLRPPHVQPLLQSRPALGFVEVHAENHFADGGAAPALLDAVRERCALSLHGVGLALGSAAGVDAAHLERLARLVQRVEPMLVSDHASFARAPCRAGEPPRHANDLLPLAFTEASLAILAANVERVQERLRRPILVENLSAYVGWADDAMPEPEFFNRLARRSGCGLLLDLNNLVVNALNAGGDEAGAVETACAWVDAIEPRCVGEIHLARHHRGGALVVDDHGARVPEAVWRVYRHAVERLGAVPTLIEWDNALPPLDVLLAEAATARAIVEAARADAEVPA